MNIVFNVLIKKWNSFWKTPRIVMKKIEGLFLFKYLPDKIALKIQYKNRFLKKLDLTNPLTFNEKLHWLKLYDRKSIYTKMVDKYEVKNIVGKIIGASYIIPTLGIWNSFDEIDFTTLPNQFVLKTTHSGGNTGVVVCRDKFAFDIKYARVKLSKSLKTNTYLQGREWPYKHVKPRIIAEKYLEDPNSIELKDYKFMCFNGKVKCLFVCSGRNIEDEVRVTFFDRDWNIMPFERDHLKCSTYIPKPHSYSLMVELSEKLSKTIPFVRVDFYEIGDKPFFGELTFYPGGGMERFQPEEWDYKLGQWLKLPLR